MNTQNGKLCSSLHNKLFNLRKVNKYTNFETRLKFLNAHIMGNINYLLPLYKGCNIDLIAKIHKVIICAAKTAIGNPCFKKSNAFMLNKCKWLPINKLIDCAVLNLIHKIIINKTPSVIYNYYKIPNRAVVDITTKYIPKQVKTEKFYIYSGIKMYNKISVDIKNSKNFKGKLKIHISGVIPDTND